MLFLLFIYGAVMGSFMNSLVYRFESNVRVITKHSYCPSCKKSLVWYELVPLASFLFLRGKCRSCAARIPRHYFFLELTSGVGCLVAGIFACFPLVFDTSALHSMTARYHILFIALIPFLIFFFVFDLRTGLVPDVIVLPLCALLLVVNLFLSPSWILSLFAGILSGGFFALQFFISRGKWVGSGDIRLGFFMGLLLGWPAGAIALLVAYVGGAVISIVLLLFGKARWKTEIPFAVFLMPATFVAAIAGDSMLSWYLDTVPRLVEKIFGW